MRGEMLSGHLELMLLAIAADEPSHGYAILQALKERSGGTFDLPEGTVYPALHRLQQEGLLTSTWQTHEGRRRRVYSATPDGRRKLRERVKDWQQFSRAVSTVVGTE